MTHEQQGNNDENAAEEPNHDDVTSGWGTPITTGWGGPITTGHETPATPEPLEAPEDTPPAHQPPTESAAHPKEESIGGPTPESMRPSLPPSQPPTNPYPDFPQQPPLSPPLPPNTNNQQLGVLSIVLGVISLSCCGVFAPIGIILALVYFNQVSQAQPVNEGNRNLAYVSLAVNGLGVLLFVLSFIGLIF